MSAQNKRPAAKKKQATRGRGRPSFVPTKQQRELVQSAAGIGQPQEQIASLIGIAKSTLQKHFASELVVGSAKANYEILTAAFKKAKSMESRHNNMTIFWCKARCGFVETTRSEVTGAGGAPLEAVHIYLPDNGRGKRGRR